MRTTRQKLIKKGCYYHACARIAGAKDDYLFTDVDKEKGMKIVEDISKLFFVEVISMCWMSNHWHIVLYTPSEKEQPTIKAVINRYNDYYNGTQPFLDLDSDIEKCTQVASQLIDLSFFMRQIHQKFTYYINRVHNRKGTLWSERFKSVILDGKEALWNCVKYIELNPVRANIVADAADYKFSTWGNCCGTGKHLFEDNFVKHIQQSLGEVAKDWSKDEIYAEFRDGIAQTICYETDEENVGIVKDKQKVGMRLKFLERTRNWSDGSIIGSKTFIQETALQFDKKKRVLNKKLSSDLINGENMLFCYKRLKL